MENKKIRRVFITQEQYEALKLKYAAMFTPSVGLSMVEWFRDHDHTEYWLLNPDGSKPHIDDRFTIS